MPTTNPQESTTPNTQNNTSSHQKDTHGPQKASQATDEHRSTSPVPGQHQSEATSSEEKSSDFESDPDSDSDSNSNDSAVIFLDEFRHLLDGKAADPETTQQPYEIVEIFGKGLGMIATRDIVRGERILVERPLIRHGRQFDDSEIIDKYEQLSSTEKSQISKLHNVRPGKKHPILGIIWTNSISLSKQESGLFIVASRLNHACASNSTHAWNETIDAMTVHATKTIRKGEEITDSYLEGCANQADRQATLADSFGFVCDCSRCCAFGADKEQSDYRLGRIADLNKELALALPLYLSDGPDTLTFRLYHKIQKLLSYYEAEGIADSQPVKAYLYAYRLSCRLGLGSRIIESARRIIEIHTAVKGDDHPFTNFWRVQLEAKQARLASIDTDDELVKGSPPEGDRERKLWLFMSEGDDSSEDWGDLYKSAGASKGLSKGEWSAIRRTRR